MRVFSISCRNTVAACCLWLGLSTAARIAAEPPAGQPAAPVDFARDVQPLFEKHCYECHGPKKQEGGFRLDQRAAALAGGELGGDIVPGKGAESLLVKALLGMSDEVTRMPAKREPLSAAEVARIKSWIDAGASWPEVTVAGGKDPRQHWAFRPPMRSAIPAVKNSAWVKNDVDRFVLARLEKEGLTPSPSADKVTLLRRLSLDLIGLPPSIAEVDAFLADASDGAFYERQVERLLASPHYGERWGRHWLDAARYADCDGFEKDKSRDVWMYRDWVIGALNRDLPYDQFIIEQLAGDLLPGATQDQIVATGFLRNSMLNEEGGIDPEQFRMEAMFDRMDAVGQERAGADDPVRPVPQPQVRPDHAGRVLPAVRVSQQRPRGASRGLHARGVDGPRRALRADARDRGRAARLDARLGRADGSLGAQVAAAGPEWEVLRPEIYEDVGGGAKLRLLADQSMLCAGYAPTHCTFRVVGKSKLNTITAIRLELLTDPNLPRGGPGRSFKGTCGADARSRSKPRAADAPADAKHARVQDRRGHRRLRAARNAAWSRTSTIAPARSASSGRSSSPSTARTKRPGASTPGRAAATRTARRSFSLKSRSSSPPARELTISPGAESRRLEQRRSPEQPARPLPRQSLRRPTRIWLPIRCRSACARFWPCRATSGANAQTLEVFSYWRTTVPEWKEANERIEALWQQWPAGTTALVLQTRDEARETRMLKRGDFLKPAATVTAGVPAFLHPLPADAPPTRLTLARWLVDRDSPTTARVAMNRVWQAYFGTGIVATSEDLGMQSEPASHGELLDWLACEFMDRGWSMKAMHRLIVESATYRQSSRVTPELTARDPLQPPAGPRPAVSGRRRNRARHRAGGQRTVECESGRAEHLLADS